MKKSIVLIALVAVFSFETIAQGNIIKVEYFFNSDPGFGKGSAIPVVPAVSINDFPYSIPITNLATGLQNLFVRSSNANNIWSVTNHLLFYKTTLPPLANISAAEYFIDIDPGFGKASVISLLANGSNMANISVPVNVVSVSLGLHTLYIRSKDLDGKWSITGNLIFLKTALSAASNIVKAEYFIDNDPGFDKAIGVTRPLNGANMSNVAESVNLGGVTDGLHHLYIRSQDANSSWSLTNVLLFYKSSGFLQNVSDAEYFIDTDPGFGQAHKFPAFTPATSLTDINYSIDLTGTDSGIHRLFIRTKNAGNKWSITNYLQFRKTVALPLTLLSFEATALNNQVMLEWQTDNEQNTSHFEIEYSTDGASFSRIATMAAKGFLSGRNTYGYIHGNASRDHLNYYRLKQVDNDNKFTYSAVRSVTLVSSRTFSISPNPVHNNLTIYTSEQRLTVHIFDSDGRSLLSRKITGSGTSIDFSSMANGIYYVVAEKNGKPVNNQKIVKH